MFIPIRASIISTLLTGCFSLTTACDRPNNVSSLPIAPSPSTADSSVSQPAIAASPVTAPDPYEQALDRAKSAFALSQAAQSKDDWRLVAGRWQQAITLMQAVPSSSPHRTQAQQKVGEYQRNLAAAQRQASRSSAVANPDGVIVLTPTAAPPALPNPPVLPNPPAQPTQPSVSRQRFSAPIVRRAGNTPVINVTFNGSQTFEMIVDTGASGTLITRSMAATLGVVPVGQASVDTASARDVRVPLGYVNSISVSGVVSQNVLVAIAGPELSLGLLGHDFFGNYDVTIREREVEFQER